MEIEIIERRKGRKLTKLEVVIERAKGQERGSQTVRLEDYLQTPIALCTRKLMTLFSLLFVVLFYCFFNVIVYRQTYQTRNPIRGVFNKKNSFLLLCTLYIK